MTRMRRAAVALLVACGIVALGALPAVAAPSSDLTVSVPPFATPTPTPSATVPPDEDPPTQEPPGEAFPPANPPATNSPGGIRSGSSTGTTGTPAPTPAGPATEPPLGTAPSTTAEQAETDRETYALGDAVTVTMGGFTPGEQVQIVLFSEPRLIGNVAAGEDGVLTHRFLLPDDLPVGVHTVQLTGWESQHVGTAQIFVTATAATAVSDGQGVPPWAWWVGGVFGALLVGAGGWWLVRTMRVPDGAEAVA